MLPRGTFSVELRPQTPPYQSARSPASVNNLKKHMFPGGGDGRTMLRPDAMLFKNIISLRKTKTRQGNATPGRNDFIHIRIRMYPHVSICMHIVSILYDKCLNMLQNVRIIIMLTFWEFVWCFLRSVWQQILCLLRSIVLDRSWSPKAIGKHQHMTK